MLTVLDKTNFALVGADQQRVMDNLNELYDKVLDTMAPNTKKAYLSDFGQYLAFCRNNGLPSLASDWRTTKVSIERYFDNLFTHGYAQHNAKNKTERKPYKHYAIRRKLASIRFFIGIVELPDPFKHSKLFRMYIDGQLKEKPKVQAQAPAMTQDIIESITESSLDTSLLMLRNLTIINVGFDSLFRASNLIGIKLEHIDWQKNTIYAPYSKTDQSGEGHYGYISNATITLMREWIDRAEIENGYLFRTLSPKQTVQGKPLTTRTLWGIYKQIGRMFDAEQNWSCHSTRTGGVISMVHNRVPILEIIEHGGWKSAAMPARYSAQYEVAKTGMGRVR